MRGLWYFILSILSQAYSSTVRVIGFVGHNVTLPCSYDVQTYGALNFCWGEGEVPTFKCSNTIVSWAEGTVYSLSGLRYQIRGAVADGDVSLTIIHARWSDAGVYGCRVEVPGWFNDQKANVHLSMEEEPEEEATTLGFTQLEAQDMTTYSSFKSAEEVYVLSSVTKEEHNFFSFLEAENIGRLAAVVLVTIILILAFIFRRRLVPGGRAVEQFDTPALENHYESVPMH